MARGREDRQVGAALLDQLELVLPRSSRGSRRRRSPGRAAAASPSLNAAFCASRQCVVLRRRGGVVAVAIDDQRPHARSGPRVRRCAGRRCSVDGAARHHRLPTPSSFQCLGDFFHLGRAAQAVRRHALAVVGDPLGPAGARSSRVERGSDLVGHARRFARRATHSALSASIPLTMTERIILIAEARPIRAPTTRRREAERGEQRRAARRHAGPQTSSGTARRRGDRRHDRDVDIAPAGRLDPRRRRALGVGRDRVHVAPSAPARAWRAPRIVPRPQRLVGGDQRDDQNRRRQARPRRSAPNMRRRSGYSARLAAPRAERSVLRSKARDAGAEGVIPFVGEGHPPRQSRSSLPVVRVRHCEGASGRVLAAANRKLRGLYRLPEVCSPPIICGGVRGTDSGQAPAASRCVPSGRLDGAFPRSVRRSPPATRIQIAADLVWRKQAEEVAFHQIAP